MQRIRRSQGNLFLSPAVEMESQARAIPNSSPKLPPGTSTKFIGSHTISGVKCKITIATFCGVNILKFEDNAINKDTEKVHANIYPATGWMQSMEKTMKDVTDAHGLIVNKDGYLAEEIAIQFACWAADNVKMDEHRRELKSIQWADGMTKPKGLDMSIIWMDPSVITRSDNGKVEQTSYTYSGTQESVKQMEHWNMEYIESGGAAWIRNHQGKANQLYLYTFSISMSAGAMLHSCEVRRSNRDAPRTSGEHGSMCNILICPYQGGVGAQDWPPVEWTDRNLGAFIRNHGSNNMFLYGKDEEELAEMLHEAVKNHKEKHKEETGMELDDEMNIIQCTNGGHTGNPSKALLKRIYEKIKEMAPNAFDKRQGIETAEPEEMESIGYYEHGSPKHEDANKYVPKLENLESTKDGYVQLVWRPEGIMLQRNRNGANSFEYHGMSTAEKPNNPDNYSWGWYVATSREEQAIREDRYHYLRGMTKLEKITPTEVKKLEKKIVSYRRKAKANVKANVDRCDVQYGTGNVKPASGTTKKKDEKDKANRDGHIPPMSQIEAAFKGLGTPEGISETELLELTKLKQNRDELLRKNNKLAETVKSTKGELLKAKNAKKTDDERINELEESKKKLTEFLDESNKELTNLKEEKEKWEQQRKTEQERVAKEMSEKEKIITELTSGGNTKDLQVKKARQDRDDARKERDTKIEEAEKEKEECTEQTKLAKSREIQSTANMEALGQERRLHTETKKKIAEMEKRMEDVVQKEKEIQGKIDQGVKEATQATETEKELKEVAERKLSDIQKIEEELRKDNDNMHQIIQMHPDARLSHAMTSMKEMQENRMAWEKAKEEEIRNEYAEKDAEIKKLKAEKDGLVGKTKTLEAERVKQVMELSKYVGTPEGQKVNDHWAGQVRELTEKLGNMVNKEVATKLEEEVKNLKEQLEKKTEEGEKTKETEEKTKELETNYQESLANEKTKLVEYKAEVQKDKNTQGQLRQKLETTIDSLKRDKEDLETEKGEWINEKEELTEKQQKLTEEKEEWEKEKETMEEKVKVLKEENEKERVKEKKEADEMKENHKVLGAAKDEWEARYMSLVEQTNEARKRDGTYELTKEVYEDLIARPTVANLEEAVDMVEKWKEVAGKAEESCKGMENTISEVLKQKQEKEKEVKEGKTKEEKLDKEIKELKEKIERREENIEKLGQERDKLKQEKEDAAKKHAEYERKTKEEIKKLREKPAEYEAIHQGTKSEKGNPQAEDRKRKPSADMKNDEKRIRQADSWKKEQFEQLAARRGEYVIGWVRTLNKWDMSEDGRVYVNIEQSSGEKTKDLPVAKGDFAKTYDRQLSGQQMYGARVFMRIGVSQVDKVVPREARIYPEQLEGEIKKRMKLMEQNPQKIREIASGINNMIDDWYAWDPKEQQGHSRQPYQQPIMQPRQSFSTNPYKIGKPESPSWIRKVTLDQSTGETGASSSGNSSAPKVIPTTIPEWKQRLNKLQNDQASTNLEDIIRKRNEDEQKKQGQKRSKERKSRSSKERNEDGKSSKPEDPRRKSDNKYENKDKKRSKERKDDRDREYRRSR